MILRQYKYFDLILAFFAASLLISNLAATKLVAFGPLTIDGGAVLFPLVYIFADVLTEVYGYKYARRAIWTGFAVMIVAVAAFFVVGKLPVAAEYQDQAAFDAVLGFFPRIVLASLLAYLVGEFLNAFVLAKMKIHFAGKKLWLRLIGSTLIGGLADTVVFALVAFGGILTSKDMFLFILVGWIFKTLVEVVLLPVTYTVVDFLKKSEGVDAYDTKTDFSPAKISV